MNANQLEHYIDLCRRMEKCKECSIQQTCKELRKVYAVKKLKDLFIQRRY